MGASTSGEGAGEPERLGVLPDGLGAGVLVVDYSGRIIGVNDRAETLLARRAASLIGQDAHDVLHRGSHGERVPRAQCLMVQAFLAGRTAQADQGWLERGDGSLLPMAWLVTPCTTVDGKPGAMVLFHEGAHLDVTEQQPDQAVPLSELDRLALLAETTTTLTSTLDVGEALHRLVRLVVPRLADWAVVDLITDEDDLRRVLVVHHQGGVLVRRGDLEVPMPPIPQKSSLPLSRALRGVGASLAGPETYEGRPDAGIAVVQRELFEETGMHSAVIAPLRAPREVLGALTLGRADQPGAFQDADLSLSEDIARRAGLALSNARLYQRQRRVAETMQRHLLPRMPEVPGLEMTARYLPAPHASQVGGDWYDAFFLPDGVAALAIGDVVGHDLDAAAGMAQIRNMLRAYAWSQHEPPSIIIDRLDQALPHIAEVSMATLLFGRMERHDGRWQLNWTNAGHPPPLLVTEDGRTEFLEGARGLLLGTGLGHDRTDAQAQLPPRSTLILYTDGLIESPGESIDRGMTSLRRHAAALAQRPLGVLCDQLLNRVRPTANDDDVAVLALRMPGPDTP